MEMRESICFCENTQAHPHHIHIHIDTHTHMQTQKRGEKDASEGVESLNTTPTQRNASIIEKSEE